jgi:hypothetical protein
MIVSLHHAPVELKDNVNIVDFDNPTELQTKSHALYVPPIGFCPILGRTLATCQSRERQRMKQLILGKTSTHCDE